MTQPPFIQESPVFAIRVNHDGFVPGMLRVGVDPGTYDGARMTLFAWPESQTLTFATRAEAETAASAWAAVLGDKGFRFMVMERVMVPTWKPAS
jgi:hypothetical protein